MQTRKPVGPTLTSLDISPLPSDRFAYHNRFVPFVLKDKTGNPVVSIVNQALQTLATAPPAPPPKRTKPPKAPKRPKGYAKDGGITILTDSSSNDLSQGSGVDRPGNDLELANVASDFGIILLERTRITPDGFALGEHLLSLSMAPGEEVTIEQKTFSERMVTFEEVQETDSELTTELGNTFTTELSEALSRVMSDTKSRGSNAGGSLGFSYFVSLNISAGYTDSIASALSTTEGETIRNVMTKTEKLTSRRRAQHKITMKVSDTSRFEAGNKRVIRNPNQFTPIDLVYFKLLQKLKISHERFGIRLCWAPFIPDPGIVLDQAENAERARLEQEFPLNLPTLRDRPTYSGGGAPMVVNSGTQELTQWGSPWGDMRADYWFTVTAPRAGYLWDGNTSSLTPTVTTTGFGRRGPPGVSVVLAEAGFDPNSNLNTVRVLIHAGADWGGGGAHLYMNFNATFIADTSGANAAYQAELATWNNEKEAYEKEVLRIKAERNQKIQEALAVWRVEYMKTFDPVSAAYQLLIAMLFSPADRDEGFEIEMWNKVFDFESAAFQYYPAWWSNRERRNPHKPADAFENASWMRVFLPIRPGFEMRALNLLLDRRIHTQTTDQSKATAIKKVLAELESARTTYFGGIDEIHVTHGVPCPTVTKPYICLAHWDELLPTDGTHLEVVQALTTAIDDVNERSIEDAHQLMTARIDSQTSEGELTTTVKDKVSTAAAPPDVDVHIGIGNVGNE